MRSARRLLLSTTLAIAFGSCALPLGARAQGDPCCVVTDNGGGTANHPPSCPTGYVGFLNIINGLPPGSTIQIPATLGLPGGFTSLVQVPGGTLGGMQENWVSSMQWQMAGTGVFSAYNRALNMPLSAGETHSAPRVAFSPLQSFNTVLYSLQGQLPPGDPDFDLLRITAGNGFGLPSPGHTTLSTAAGGWAVDSFFDITYRIDFIGSMTGPFAGMSGSTTGTYRFEMCHQEPTPVRAGTWGRLKQLYR